MSRQAFDDKLAGLEPFRTTPSAEAQAGLRKALKDRNNYYVARAATITGERGSEAGMGALVPNLLTAFDRFFQDPTKSDPQCWAKNAIAAALKTLGHRDAATYLRGIAHVQLEGVFGGKSDAAGPLRGSCALALIDCPLPTITILRHLTALLYDSEAGVRLDAVRGMAHLADPAGALLIRAKVLGGDASAEVQGQCFSALLAMEAAGEAVPFLARFLASPDTDTQLEAACALAQSPETSALDAVKEHWETPRPTLEIRRAILLNLGASPLRAAADFLREIIESQPRYAEAAREALATSRFR